MHSGLMLLGCKLEVDDQSLYESLAPLLGADGGERSRKIEDLDAAVPGLFQAARFAIRELEERRLPIARLSIKERAVQAVPPEHFDDQGQSCATLGCDCGKSHRSTRHSF